MKRLNVLVFTLVLASALFLPLGIANDVPFADIPFDVNNIPEPAPPPPAVRDFFELDPFYQQWINVEGFPVVASEKASPYALKEAAWQIWQMIGHRSDILKILAQHQVRLSILAHNEMTSDIPELTEVVVPHFFYNVRSRGANRPLRSGVVCSGEEVLLNSHAYAVLIHGFSHTIHTVTTRVDPEFDNRLKTTYNAAMEKGLWRDTYAATNRDEYWAEGVGSWFDGAHSDNPVKTRDALKAYDLDLATLIGDFFGDHAWRYTPLAMRLHLPHLQGFDPQSAPQLEYPPGALEAYAELRDPTINERSEWVNLPPHDPSLIPNLNGSRTRGKRTDILFVNLSGAELLLYRVDPDGTERLTYRFPPNPEIIIQFNAFVGDLLLAKDATGTPLAVFQAVEKVGRALVGTAFTLITLGLSKMSGDNQTGVSGAVLANPFVIEVRDQNLSVLEGILVAFTVIAGDGTLSVTRTMTDKNGRAESVLTLGSHLGTNTVSVSAEGIDGTVIFNAVAAAAVDMPDPNLRAAIESALGKTSGDTITVANMANLTRLEALNANISDLTGLQFATNLIELDLGAESVEGVGWVASNSVSDLSPLAGLTQLTRLELRGNSISDISALSNLTNLTRLALEDNNISDLSPLAGLTNLTELLLFGNRISDLSPLAGLTNLTWLQLFATSISDLSALSGLTNLTRLALARNDISDISALSSLINLETLGLASNNLSDISVLSGLTNLTRLGLRHNFISDISPLSGLTKLARVDMRHNAISDISPLVANTGLGNEDRVVLNDNPLSSASIEIHVPALQIRGVTVEFDPPAPPAPFENVLFDPANIPEPEPPPMEVRDFFDLPPFYQQWVNVGGFPVIASARVNPYAVKEAAWVIWQMIGHRKSILKNLGQYRQRLSVLAIDESYGDLPEYEADDHPLKFVGAHNRDTVFSAVTTASEENLLDPILNYSFLIHEFTHVIHNGLRRVGLEFDNRLNTLYNAAMKKGLWRGTYAASNRDEYLAEAVGSWFNAPYQNNSIKTREQLKRYDPNLAELIGKLFGDFDWRYTSPSTRAHLAHLRGFDFGQNLRTGGPYPWEIRASELEKQLKDPNSDGDGKWVNLKLYPPSELATLLESTERDGSAQFIWVNLTGNEISFYYVDSDGVEHYHYTAATKWWSDIGTYAGATWLIKDHNRNSLAVFRAEEKVGRVLIGPTLFETDSDGTNGDINNDGSLNVLDLVVIASEFSSEKPNLTADVNGDDVVNVLDLIWVAGMFDEAAAPPAQHAPETLTAVEVQGWLTQARKLEGKDSIMKRGIMVLGQLLVSLTPTETELLGNYPNPFNPETWIPYRLAEDAFVTLTIYDLSGQVVRTLDLGHRIAAVYENRSKAIYWDGRNDLGEQVASGVYFYTLTAGNYSATRRMVILK